MNCISGTRGKNFPASALVRSYLLGGPELLRPVSEEHWWIGLHSGPGDRVSEQIHQLCLKIKPWGHWESGLEKCVELEIAKSVFQVKSKKQRNRSWKKNIINQRVGNNNNILLMIFPCAHHLSKAEDEGSVLTLPWGSLVPRLPVEMCYMQDILPEERSPSPSHPQPAISLAWVTPQ